MCIYLFIEPYVAEACRPTPGFLAVRYYVSTRVIQKVSSDGLLRKKTRIYYKPFILPFDVHTVHYLSI
jgi:hypothetical protein